MDVESAWIEVRKIGNCVVKYLKGMNRRGGEGRRA
jgi:hypothetical protein